MDQNENRGDEVVDNSGEEEDDTSYNETISLPLVFKSGDTKRSSSLKAFSTDFHCDVDLTKATVRFVVAGHKKGYAVKYLEHVYEIPPESILHDEGRSILVPSPSVANAGIELTDKGAGLDHSVALVAIPDETLVYEPVQVFPPMLHQCVSTAMNAIKRY